MADDEQPLKAPVRAPEMVHRQHALSPHRNAEGYPIKGRNEVSTASITRVPAPRPNVGEAPALEMFLAERSQDGKSYRYRILGFDAVEHEALTQLLEAAANAPPRVHYDSGMLGRSERGAGYRKAMHRFDKLRRRIFGVITGAA